MTQEKVNIIKSKISSRKGSELRNLFYTNKGLPRQKLYTMQQILDTLNIPEADNEFEKEGINSRLHTIMGVLRREAKKHGLAFIDFKIEKEDSRDVYYHGFLRDIDKLEKTIELYNGRVDKMKELYKVTYDTARSQIAMIEHKERQKQLA